MPYADPQKEKEYKKEWHLRRTGQKKKWLNEYKRNKPCVSCGKILDPLFLDLHHIDPNQKEQGISKIIQGTEPLSKLKKEVKKCEVICSHCHRLHHYKKQSKNDNRN